VRRQLLHALDELTERPYEVVHLLRLESDLPLRLDEEPSLRADGVNVDAV